MGVDRAALIADPGRGLEPSEARAFQDAARRRTQREPVAYILGRKGFRRIELDVDPRVLIPRPETEHVVEAALALPQGARVVDVGTGSGAIALALADERPDLRVTGTDTSADALVVARANAARLGLDVEFLEGDLLAPVAGPIDAVVSNPPYVRDGEQPGARDHPARAGRGAVRRRRTGSTSTAGSRPPPPRRARRSRPSRSGPGRRATWRRCCAAAGFGDVDVVPDLAGIERVVVGRR